jgi:hypothetical protein
MLYPSAGILLRLGQTAFPCLRLQFSVQPDRFVHVFGSKAVLWLSGMYNMYTVVHKVGLSFSYSCVDDDLFRLISGCIYV